MYRKRFNLISSRNIVDFLIFDREFPRSILYCIRHAERAYFNINGTPFGVYDNDLARQFGKLMGKLNYSYVDEVMAIGLHQFLDEIQSDLNNVSDGIHDNFFAIKPVSELNQIGAQIQ